MLGNRPEDLIGVRAQRFKSVLQKTRDEAEKEGIPDTHPLIASLLVQIDGIDYILGKEGSMTEAFIIEGERLAKQDAGSN